MGNTFFAGGGSGSPIPSNKMFQAPTTTLGRMICIFYALIGIPLNAMLIGSLGNLFKVNRLKIALLTP